MQIKKAGQGKEEGRQARAAASKEGKQETKKKRASKGRTRGRGTAARRSRRGGNREADTTKPPTTTTTTTTANQTRTRKPNRAETDDDSDDNNDTNNDDKTTTNQNQTEQQQKSPDSGRDERPIETQAQRAHPTERPGTPQARVRLPPPGAEDHLGIADLQPIAQLLPAIPNDLRPLSRVETMAPRAHVSHSLVGGSPPVLKRQRDEGSAYASRQPRSPQPVHLCAHGPADTARSR